MKKIAITGVSNEKRLIVCNALSNLTGFDVVRCTPYSGFSIKHSLDKSLIEYEWHELYSYILQSFVERIDVESSYDEYISNGSVFNELAFMEAMKVNPSYKKQNTRNTKFLFMGNSLKSVISEYAQKYERIIHITCDSLNVDDFYVEKCLKTLIENSGVPHFIYGDNALLDILNKFSDMPDLKIAMPPLTAIRKAEIQFSEL